MNAFLKQWTKGARWIPVVLVVVILSLTIVPSAQAGEFVEGDPDATVGEGEIIEDDLFIAGQTVRVEGMVEGDLFAAGETVIISGVVEGNLFAAANEILFSGEVYGSAHVAGYAITLEDGAFIGHNLYLGAFSLLAENQSTIDRSVYVGAYQVVLNGEVGRDVTAGVAAFEVNGYVNGDVTVDIGEPDPDVAVDPSYWQPWMFGAPVQVDVVEPGFRVDDDAVGGEVIHRRVRYNANFDVDVPDIQIDPALFVVNRAIKGVGEFMSLLIIGAAGLFLGREWFEKSVAQVRTQAAANTGWGLAVIALYIPVVLLALAGLIVLTLFFGFLTLGNLAGEILSIGGLFLGGFTALFGLLVGLVTKTVVGYVVGYWVLSGLMNVSVESNWAHFGALALGVFLYEVLRALPGLGLVVMVAVVLIGTGAIFSVVRNRFWPAEAAA